MIINLAESLLEFMENHNLNAQHIEYVSYQCGIDGARNHCTMADFIDVAEGINFEDYDPLIKYREPIKSKIDIVAEGWFIRNSSEPGSIWVYNELPEPTGDYEPITEEDIIEEVDIIDSSTVELLTKVSPNLDYVKDTITINNITYKIDNIDGLEKVVDIENRVAVILACNPLGRYWTTPSTEPKDPQILYHPELVKLVLEYRSEHEIKGYPLLDGDIESVFNIEELSNKYNLEFGEVSNLLFNNLRIAWLPKGGEYVIEFTGAVSHADLRHEIVKNLTRVDTIKL